MTPKPLTKEFRDTLAQQLDDLEPRCVPLILSILEAEQFWREAVKKMKNPIDWNGVCDFCERDLVFGDKEHKPDCHWILAQEEP